MEISTIQSKIYEIRGVKVMLDFDLAAMYQVETKKLKQSVRRNINRFPGDFMFEITREEYNLLRSQIVTLKDESDAGRGKHAKYLPFAFTEGGVAMLSGLLNSEIAVMVNINIMRAFVAIRNYLIQHVSTSEEIKALKERVNALEDTSEENLKAINDLSEDTERNLDDIYIALSELANKQKAINEATNKPRRPVGYIQPEDT
jgi:hypothetical protein